MAQALTKAGLTALRKGLEASFHSEVRDPLVDHFNRSQGGQNQRLEGIEQHFDGVDRRFDEVDAKLSAIMEMFATRQELRALVRELKARGIALDESRILA